jgi:hypothetical protein
VVFFEGTEQGAFLKSRGLNPFLYSTNRAYAFVRGIGDSYGASFSQLVTLCTGDENNEALGSEGEIFNLYVYQLRASERACESEEKECTVTKPGKVVNVLKAACKKVYCLKKYRSFSVLKGSFLATY